MSIVCGSLTRYIMTMNDKHPNKDSTCIEYSLTNVMLPTVLLGSTAGVLINILFPNLVLKTGLGILLAYVSYKMGVKSKDLW